MKKQLLGAMVCLCVALLLPSAVALPARAAAEPGPEAWSGSADTRWYDESGSETSFTINTPEELAGLAELVNGGNDFSGKTIILGSGLDLGDQDWTPIGTHIIYDIHNDPNDPATFSPFQGSFDGGGHTISGLYINANPADWLLDDRPPLSYDVFISVGLFGYVGEHGTVENLDVSGMVSCVRYEKEGDRTSGSSDYAGGVVGYNEGVVKNCSNSADVYGGGAAGGVVGYCASSSGTIEHCSNTGSILAKSNYNCYAGGIVGFYSYSEEHGIVDCFNSGAVCAREWSDETAHVANVNKAAGGIVGGSCALIRNCFNSSSGSVSAGSWGSQFDTYPCAAGGIVGKKQNPGTVENCCNYGKISILYGAGATRCYIGGIAGCVLAVDYVLYEESGTVGVKNCCSRGTISVKTNSYAENRCPGGIVGCANNRVPGSGRVNLSITNCYYNSAVNNGVLTRSAQIEIIDVHSKGSGDFSSGEIAWYLQNPEKVNTALAPQEGQVWGQQLKKDPHDTSPILTTDPNKRVHRVIFLRERDSAAKVGTRYANIDGVVSLLPLPGTDDGIPTVWTADGITAFTEYTEVSEDMTVYPAERDSVDNTVTITVTTTYGTPAEEKNLGKYLRSQDEADQAGGNFTYSISKIEGDENTGPAEIMVTGSDLMVPAGVDAGTYKLQIAVHEKAPQAEPESMPYGADDVKLNVIVRINKAAPLKLEISVTMDRNDTAEVKLTETPGYPPYPGGEPKLEVKDFTKSGLTDAVLDAGTGVLTLTSGAGEISGNVSDTVNVKLSGMRNYEDSSIAVTVNYREPDTPQNPPATTYTITVLSTDNGAVTSDKDEAAADETVTLAVTPNGGYRLAAGSLTVTKTGGGSTWNVPVSGKGVPGALYTFAMPAGNVEVTAQFSKIETGVAGGGTSSGTSSGTGGGGGWSGSWDILYTVRVLETPHGKVTSNRSRAESGATVTLTAAPDAGYELISLRAEDRDGKGAALKDKGNGAYTFSMPSSDVTVTAAFASRAAAPSGGGKQACPRDNTCPMARFVDLNANLWYHDGIHYCIENGLMSGVSRLYFAPDISTNRAMFATMLYRLEGEPAAGSGSFTDVPAGKWYAAPIAWAAANGIMEGYGNGRFQPEAPITREQMAATLYRYARYKGYDVSAWGNLADYTDGGGVSGWAADAMRWAVGEGLITGISSRIPFLDPAGDATRAQVATILMRFRTGVMK